MDIPRPGQTRKRAIRRGIFIAVAASVLLIATVGLAQLRPAAPSVDRASLWIDAVKRGTMRREVRGPGTLVPEEVRWIPAVSEGSVDRILVQPGTTVTADTILLELTNPDVERAALDAGWQLKAGHAEYVDLKVRLESQLLNQRAAAASVRADYHQARLKADVDAELAREGLISDLNLKLSRVRVEELATRDKIEARRVQIGAESLRAQLAVQEAKLEQLRALDTLRQEQRAGLQVRAGIDGVLQELPVEVGQRVVPGTTLAKVARPDKLKTVLRIPQTQAKDVQIGQAVSIDTHDKVVAGKVVRIDPAVRNDTVAVDVAFTEPMPRSARPDLSVDGTILIEQLQDVLYVGRPVFGQANAAVQLFRLDPDAAGAERVTVKLGRSSVNTIEVLEGLRQGDQVVLSDMSAWDETKRIRFK